MLLTPRIFSARDMDPWGHVPLRLPYGIKAVLDTISDLKMFILNTMKAGFNVCFTRGIGNCFKWETIWKWIGYWESYSLSLINKSISKNYVQLFNFIHFASHVLQVIVLGLPSFSFILIFVIDYSIVLLTYHIFVAFLYLKSDLTMTLKRDIMS